MCVCVCVRACVRVCVCACACIRVCTRVHLQHNFEVTIYKFHCCFQGWVFNVVPWLVTIPSGIGSGWVADYLIAKGECHDCVLVNSAVRE